MHDTEAPGRFDLHTHSVFSDGTTTPDDIARETADAGLVGFALTDHDTTAGWDDARDAAAAHGVDFLPGIELTTHSGRRSAHLLAYGPDPADLALGAELALLRDSRVHRARAMADRLSADFTIDWDAVFAIAGRSVGRPHLADALVAGGYAVDRSAAFASILSPSGPYYLPIYALDTVEAIRLVRAAGGLPVLAHPAAERQRSAFGEAEIADLAGAGLWGIELDHPENLPEWLPALRASAARHGLVVTGASDYHGAGKPNRLGERSSDASIVARIRAEVATPR
ncbi:PHP domain-containing protein [Leucobacter rhizosphaerae]|uniref:PHP domain-containing protein n=1 Tax=Leucobacter rhizosphaerae TaxID=2932245 RepID=A0ABY4FWE8_9MICO|nr:PHP domain-containing protein [Leucobacter rhizosphaerae]UOQ60621.1 PHP domain-containing protein [Leucobacter rhizosphaerae]